MPHRAASTTQHLEAGHLRLRYFTIPLPRRQFVAYPQRLLQSQSVPVSPTAAVEPSVSRRPSARNSNCSRTSPPHSSRPPVIAAALPAITVSPCRRSQSPPAVIPAHGDLCTTVIPEHEDHCVAWAQAVRLSSCARRPLRSLGLGACPRIRSWRRNTPRNNLLTAIWT